MYLLLLQFRQVTHEKKIALGKLYDKSCTYNLLNENQRHQDYFESYLYIIVFQLNVLRNDDYLEYS